MNSNQRSGLNTQLLKDRIRSSFSKAALRYDSFASLQKEVGEELLKRVISQHPISHIPHPGILDIGCGTGFLTYCLAQAFPEAFLSGCDISHEMIKVASCKLQVARDNKIHLTTTDGGVLPFKDNSFDMVASNLTYQWLLDLKAAFLEAYRVLRPGGVFTFSTLGPGTLKELRTCYVETLNIKRADNTVFEIPNPKSQIRNQKNALPPFIGFSEEKTIFSAFENTGFSDISIETTNNIQTYPDMWTLLKTMKTIGAGNPFKEGNKSLARGSLLKRMADVYEDVFSKKGSLTHHSSLTTDHCIYATYEVLFVKCVKQATPLKQLTDRDNTFWSMFSGYKLKRAK